MHEKDKKYLQKEFNELLGLTEVGLKKNIRSGQTGQRGSKTGEEAMEVLRKEAEKCKACALCKSRLNLVFGEGKKDAGVMFIGEAPGGEEDKTGRPFVGRAGRKLTEMIENPRSLDLPRNSVYICNILKCRPPGNRNPKREEVEACSHFLLKQIEIINPSVICGLGTFAAQWLMKTSTPISLLRGKKGAFQDIPVIPTYHPSYIIRNPHNTRIRKEAWEDMLAIKKIVNEQN